ncbi:hypothetical protein TH15_14840 [Thalassospira profundimaris]|uniref:Uncharacterized protein n=1 Tax=Thalassospira indica TaxID=1891279 RepID=A0ABM6XYB2_9PROT|nr:hypothetical protein DY252_11110 [Thalassospira indica]OAZ12695.1 hypothetical protein TH15_14840 [Thalassospira profundimaris]
MDVFGIAITQKDPLKAFAWPDHPRASHLKARHLANQDILDHRAILVFTKPPPCRHITLLRSL